MLSYCTIKGTERGAAYMAAPLLFGTFFMLFESHSSSISILISHLILELSQANLCVNRWLARAFNKTKRATNLGTLQLKPAFLPLLLHHFVRQLLTFAKLLNTF